jgi:hypothetical protein
MAPRQNRTTNPNDPKNYQFPGIERQEERSFNNNIERMAMENNSRFHAGAERVNQQIMEAEARRARGENVPEPYPGATTSMVKDIEREYEATTNRLKNEIRSLYSRTPTGAPPDPRWIQNQVNELNREHTTEFQKKIHARYGHTGDQVLEGIGNEVNGHSMLGNALTKMGTTGGIIGALAAGFMAFSAMGGMQGGAMAMVGGLVGVMLGGVLGGTINEWVSDSMRKPALPLDNDVTKDNKQGKGQGQNQDQQQSRAPEQPPQPEEELVAGNLNPGSTPTRGTGAQNIEIS